MFLLQTSFQIAESAPVMTMLVIAVTAAISIVCFRKQQLFEKLLFEVEPILSFKEWWRVLSSGFIHLSWMHLIMNMVVLYFFGEFLEIKMGAFPFLAVYIVCLIVASLVALFIHRNHADYAAGGRGRAR